MFLRSLLVSIKGRISSIAAPVVPIIDAKRYPIPKNVVFTIGFAAMLPAMRIPPVTTNKEPSKIMKGM